MILVAKKRRQMKTNIKSKLKYVFSCNEFRYSVTTFVRVGNEVYNLNIRDVLSVGLVRIITRC